MNKLLLTLAASLFAATASAEPRMDGGNISIARNSVAVAGGRLIGTGYILDGVTGESAVADLSGGTFIINNGLGNLLAQPGTITSVTGVTKSSGTLDIKWVAPGRDGFIGAMSAAFYRIDASSDPLHVFAPTTYLTEFSTNVTPGQSQFYQLTSLLPNTTYFARVYLADERKVVAEQSAQAAESTLSLPPSVPTFAGVFSTSATITWTIPAGGASGYRIDGSSTNFGFLFPGGLVASTNTANGTVVTLTIPNLQPGATYFFKLGSLNWQGQPSFTTIITTVTDRPPFVFGLGGLTDAWKRRVQLTWNTPGFTGLADTTVVFATYPIVALPATGVSYALGTPLGDGSVVKSTGAGSSYLDVGLELDTTAYFNIYTKTIGNSYSLAVSTFVVLDLPPMSVAALKVLPSVDGSSVTLNWSHPISNADGSLFKPSAGGWNLDHYDVYRSSSLFNPTWSLVTSTPSATSNILTALPNPAQVYYYKVVSRDAFPGQNLADDTMVVDTSNSLFVMAADGITRVRLPNGSSSILEASGNPTGKPLVLRIVDKPEDTGNKVVKSVSVNLVGQDDQPVTFVPKTVMSIDMHYDVSNGQVVTSGVAALPPINANNAGQMLSAYMLGAQNDARNIFGTVDPLTQTVHVDSSLQGTYQIRAVARDLGFSFDLSGISNKAITPNGDGLNDTVVFTFDNPKDSEFNGKIYDVRGGLVADLTAGPIFRSSLMWDGKAGGKAVPRGVYIYQIKAEGKVFNGTVVVIR